MNLLTEQWFIGHFPGIDESTKPIHRTNPLLLVSLLTPLTTAIFTTFSLFSAYIFLMKHLILLFVFFSCHCRLQLTYDRFWQYFQNKLCESALSQKLCLYFVFVYFCRHCVWMWVCCWKLGCHFQKCLLAAWEANVFDVKRYLFVCTTICIYSTSTYKKLWMPPLLYFLWISVSLRIHSEVIDAIGGRGILGQAECGPVWQLTLVIWLLCLWQHLFSCPTG